MRGLHVQFALAESAELVECLGYMAHTLAGMVVNNQGTGKVAAPFPGYRLCRGTFSIEPVRNILGQTKPCKGGQSGRPLSLYLRKYIAVCCTQHKLHTVMGEG